jgi:citrate lyase subunit beta / citryl-CoA lyase
MSERRPYRSTLFVPAGKDGWVDKAVAAGPDAIILDLEDAVSEQGKDRGRASALDDVKNLVSQQVPVYVRINALSTPHWLADVQTLVGSGLSGIALPKILGADDVVVLDRVLGALEGANGLPVGQTEIQPIFETALGMQSGFAILTASKRIKSFHAGTARHGDVNASLDYVWTPDGLETIYLRSKLLLEGRAAGVPYPLTGVWTDIRDLEGFEKFAKQGRQLGYTGMYLIHPAHVELANRTFTPTAEEIARYREIVRVLEAVAESGNAAVQLDGAMVDVAMVTRAKAALALADALGVAGSPLQEAGARS